MTGHRYVVASNDRRILPPLLLALLGAVTSMSTPAQSLCGNLTNGFGPFDYRKEVGTADYKSNPNNPLYLVESAHFRPEMEALIRGGQGARSAVAPELDYTLRAFPNHHRALIAATRLAERQKTDQIGRYTVDCWFERAVRFQRDDIIVRMLYASYLASKGRREDATTHLEIATQLASDNAFSHYNIGMVYADMQVYDRALAQAHRSSELGMLRTELKERLVAAGHWRDVEPKPHSTTASTPTASRATQ